MTQKKWYQQWFNEDYLNLYAHRDEGEAEKQVENICNSLNINMLESILDLACGTGRHSFILAKRGLQVTAVDASESLIAIAKKEAWKNPHLNIEFLVADMFSLDLHRKFDIILSLFTSFGYSESDEENFSLFSTVCRHLKTGGTYLLDYLHPDAVVRNLVPKENLILKGEPVTITRRIENNRVIKTITFPGREYQESVALYTREQIENELEKHQLHPIAIWDDFEGTPWKANGNRQIFISKGAP